MVVVVVVAAEEAVAVEEAVVEDVVGASYCLTDILHPFHAPRATFPCAVSCLFVTGCMWSGYSDCSL